MLTRRFAVVVTDTGFLAWIGEADSARTACALAAMTGKQAAAPFQPYDFEFPTHKDDDVVRLVLTVYDVSHLEPSEVRRLRGGATSEWLSEEIAVGSFAATLLD